tara:strand:- start:1440 stop:2240 length:801 start_codon:yes stop_codon:yes gene_type:complete
MRPIPSPIGKDALFLLNKAQQLLEKAEKLEMVEHDGKKVPAFAADGKGEKDMKAKADMATKDKYCMKNFGKKYSECSAKEKAQCDRVHGKVEKGKKCPDCKNNDCPTCKMEKGEKCPSCGEKMNKMGCTKMGCKMNRMEKAEKCPSCGSKMEKGGCMKMGCMKMKKSAEAGSQPGFTTSFDSSPGGVMFLAESGGQTRSAYYTTNQYPYNAEDVANKGAMSESVSFDGLAPKLNPHDAGGVDRQVENGVLSKARAAFNKALRDASR